MWFQWTARMSIGITWQRTQQTKRLPWFTCKNEGFHDLLVYFISKLSIPWTSMVCATCNSFPRQVTPVWWSYMAHIFLCLFIFPKSNHSSPYDDDVAPDFLEHPPYWALTALWGLFLCLFLFTCLCDSADLKFTWLHCGRINLMGVERSELVKPGDEVLQW